MVCSIICPHCQFCRQMDAAAVPARQVTATCPRCRQTFPLDGVAARELAEAVTSPTSPEMMPPPELTASTPVLKQELPPPPEPPWDMPRIEAPPGALPLRSTPVRPITFRFTATAREYFGIWIVNTLLKIVTLGGYTAWAKVRTRRYLYGCTQLQGNIFDYVAEPWALFRGWLIGAVLALLYALGSRFSPTLALGVMIIVTLAVPWLIVRSRMFNCRNTTYRNIRFAFRPNYREAYEVFLGLGMLLPFTLGLIFPYMVYRQKKFLVENCSFGATRFTFNATVKEFYSLFLKAGVGLLLVLGVIFLAIGSLSDRHGLAALLMDPGTRVMVAAIMGFGIVVVYFYFLIYVQTAQVNLTWNSTCLGRGQFRSALGAGRMSWLYISNAAAIGLTLGLLIPWAWVRLTTYRLEQLEFHTAEGLDLFLAGADQQVSAVGEEVGEIFGVDLAL